jgi:hypothetical protein
MLLSVVVSLNLILGWCYLSRMLGFEQFLDVIFVEGFLIPSQRWLTLSCVCRTLQMSGKMQSSLDALLWSM